MTPASYLAIGFDRIIASDRPIAGTLPVGDAGDPVIRVHWRAARPPLPNGHPVWSRDGDALCFAPPGVGVYRCTLATIAVMPLTTADPDMVAALLVATALPALLWLADDFVLHASAVVPAEGAGPDDTGAWAIAGASGSGKSRLAAAFLARGARLVADDSIAVRRGTAGVTCAGLAGGYHLGPSGRARAFHPVAANRARRVAPLAAVVVLEARGQRRRLSPVAAVAALLANRHRASVPRVIGREADGLRDAAFLAGRLPVYSWPRDDADALLDPAVRAAIMGDDAR